ncbi:MAG: DUF488 family protein [Proteobacteria bacterium]|nr:DUF488 family protein [Pseudomonadota bacterium]
MPIAANRLRLKRAYEAPDPGDGARVLVDRLWPRGLRKADARLTAWMKDAAPTPALRQWFGHDPARWVEFRRRYRAELRLKAPVLAALRALVRPGPLTLVYAARDPQYNHARVLREVLLGPVVRRARGTANPRARRVR